MNDREVAAHWNENAPEWIRAVRAGWDVYRDYVNNPAFFAMLPDLAGKCVLDIGCGEGTNTRKLARMGASVVGVDISEAMVAAARQQEADSPLGIEYHVTSGSDLARFEDQSFDAVVSTMVMMDMPDYAGAVCEAARVLAGGGLFQFSISHPCMATRLWRWVHDEAGQRQAVAVGNYFGLEASSPEADMDEWFFGTAPAEVRKTARPFRIPRFFRTLSEYINLLVEAGFQIDRMAEPYAGDEAVEKHPGIADSRIIPYFLIIQCHKSKHIQH